MLVYGVRTSGVLVQDSVSQVPKVSKWIAPPKDKIYFVGGGAVWVDFVGLGMKIAGSKFSQMEIGGRVTIIEKIFPIFELGLASSHREGNSKDNTFSTPTSPYYTQTEDSKQAATQGYCQGGCDDVASHAGKGYPYGQSIDTRSDSHGRDMRHLEYVWGELLAVIFGPECANHVETEI